MALEKILEIINTHFDEYTEQFSTREDCINHSYEIALAVNFQDCLQAYVFEPDYFDDDEIEKHGKEYKILFEQENIYKTLVDTFLIFRHPEKTDVWGYREGSGGTKDVIDEITTYLHKKNRGEII